MKLLARLAASVLWLALPAAPAAAVVAWPAQALATADDDGQDACGDEAEDVDPPSDEPEEPEPAE